MLDTEVEHGQSATHGERMRPPMKLIVFVGMLAILYAQLYAMWDVLARQPELSFVSRRLWLIGLLVFPVIGSIAYLRTGPGAVHWPPWDPGEVDEDD